MPPRKRRPAPKGTAGGRTAPPRKGQDWVPGKRAIARQRPRGVANPPRDVPGHALRHTRKRF